MGDFTSPTRVVEAREDLIAAAKHISKALETKENLTDDEWKILANLRLQLSTHARASGSSNRDSKEEDVVDETEQQLNEIREKIEFWEKGQSWIWDGGPDEAYDYLKSVDEVRKITEALESKILHKNNENSEDDDDGDDGDGALLRWARDILQTAMSRLKEEFSHLLVCNKQPLDPERMAFCCGKGDINEAGSIVSSGGDSVDDVAQRDGMIKLVHPDVIPDLRNIANLMFDSNYGRECSQAFVNVQKDALDDCLFILKLEKLSIQDVLRMERNALSSMIRRWVRAMKIFVRVYLPSENLLCNQIFGELESISCTNCFVEASKAAVSQLLNFGEAISISPCQPELLIGVLDMYEVLADLVPDINSLYYDETGLCVINEFHSILKRLGECAKMTFRAFENKVATNVSPNASPDGGVHPLTTYVLNYISSLMDYIRTLDEIFEDEEKEYPVSDENHNGTTTTDPPTGVCFRSIMSVLESNLEEESKLYKNESLRQLFLMNNIRYMTLEVRSSELGTVLGEEWIRESYRKLRQHAMNYERATWSSIVALLKYEGIVNSRSNSLSKALLRKRLQGFYLAFEEVYNIQTGWFILDEQLREDLRISISFEVIRAYQTFVGRFSHLIEEHIKYSVEDLEHFLSDLFNGSQKSLPGGHKK